MSAENCIDTTRCPCPCLPKVTLEQAVIDLIGECMANNWQGIIFDRLERGAARNPSGKNGGNIFMDMLREESESGAQ